MFGQTPQTGGPGMFLEPGNLLFTPEIWQPNSFFDMIVTVEGGCAVCTCEAKQTGFEMESRKANEHT